MITGGLCLLWALCSGAFEGCGIVLGWLVGLWRDEANHCVFFPGILGQSCDFCSLRKHIGTFGLCLVYKSSFQIVVGAILAVWNQFEPFVFGDGNGVSWDDGGWIINRCGSSYININARMNTRTMVPPTLVTLTLSVLSTRTRSQTPSLLMYSCALGNVPDLLAYFEE